MRFVSKGIRDRTVRHIGVTVDLGGVGIAVLCGRPEPSMGWMRENNDAPVCEDCLEEAKNIARTFDGGEFTLVKRDEDGNIIGGEALNDAHVTRVFDESNNLVAYRIDRK